LTIVVNHPYNFQNIFCKMPQQWLMLPTQATKVDWLLIFRAVLQSNTVA